MGVVGKLKRGVKIMIVVRSDGSMLLDDRVV